MMITRVFSLVFAMFAASGAFAHMGIDLSEFQARRQAVMNAAPDGIVLLHSFSAPKDWNDSGFRQDSNFYYLTGLENLHYAILAIDGASRETWLFVKTPTEREKRRFSDLTGWDSVCLAPDHQTEQLLGIDHIVAWDGFADFIDARRKANPKTVLYLDQGGEGKNTADVSDPPGMTPVENPFQLWKAAVKNKWPDSTVADATLLIKTIRAVKSPAEIVLMKTAAGFTDAGFRAAMAAIEPGRTNRQVEGAAIAAALRAGADGIAMWPELQDGPVSGSIIYQKAYDYHGLNHTLQDGETVRMDLGFDYENYKGDVGRTVPVSGRFTADQREALEFMNAAYQTGLQQMHDGANADDVFQASLRYVANHRQSLHSELARQAAEQLLRPEVWVMYTHGLDMVELFPPPKTLHSGMTLAFGPDFKMGAQGFYEEDVVLITPNGYEIVNPPLPYTAAGIEKMMARGE